MEELSEIAFKLANKVFSGKVIKSSRGSDTVESLRESLLKVTEENTNREAILSVLRTSYDTLDDILTECASVLNRTVIILCSPFNNTRDYHNVKMFNTEFNLHPPIYMQYTRRDKFNIVTAIKEQVTTQPALIESEDEEISIMDNEEEFSIMDNEEEIYIMDNEEEFSIMDNEEEFSIMDNEEDILIMDNEEEFSIMDNEENNDTTDETPPTLHKSNDELLLISESNNQRKRNRSYMGSVSYGGSISIRVETVIVGRSKNEIKKKIVRKVTKENGKTFEFEEVDFQPLRTHHMDQYFSKNKNEKRPPSEEKLRVCF